MALSEFTKKQVEVKIGAFCKNLIPSYLKSELRSSFSTRGNCVTIYEEQPAFDNPKEWIKIKVAQLRFNPEAKEWTLYWCDQNDRWHRYKEIEPTPDLDSLLAVLDEDATGVFWG
ncbi:DUF3024 domain-containing protein [Desulfolucanica intricata]|uniref:DUF3024 domain-containing protein n=1 Tax=Desulfolucanica intricata TaxID=1285191 RepID=UPI000837404D|nr:DUF3024 domain-containing protein [Desulfolucanica intricata]